MRSAILDVFEALNRSSPLSCAKLAECGASGEFYACLEHMDVGEHSQKLLRVARLLASAHPGGAPPAAERVASLRALLTLTARLVDAV